jgi:energy-coupling factor transport system permease protein
MKNIIIGQYIPGTGFLYKLDPRTKIIAVLILMVAVFLLKSITQLMIAFGIAIIILIIGKISIVRVARGLKPIFILLVFTFVFQIFFNKEGTVWVDETLTFSLVSLIVLVAWTIVWRLLTKLKKFKMMLFFLYIAGVYLILRYLTYGTIFSTFNFVVHEKGVEMSIFVVIRLLIIITLSTVLTLTTKPTDLTQGIEKLMRPLKYIGISSDDFALIISISLRYIPTILDEANKIMLAQASRGADIAEGKLKDKIKQIISLLVPMFIIAFKRSEDLADAMESRNFVPGRERTRIYDLHFGLLDLMVALMTIGLLTGSIMARVLWIG